MVDKAPRKFRRSRACLGAVHQSLIYTHIWLQERIPAAVQASNPAGNREADIVFVVLRCVICSDHIGNKRRAALLASEQESHLRGGVWPHAGLVQRLASCRGCFLGATLSNTESGWRSRRCSSMAVLQVCLCMQYRGDATWLVFVSQTLFICAAMGAGVFYLATKDVRSGAKLARDGAQQFRKNIKTMREWAEEAADGCACSCTHGLRNCDRRDECDSQAHMR